MGFVYLSPKDLVERWCGKIRLGTLSNWRNKGKGPPVTKIGGRVLYRLDLLEKWEQKCQAIE